MRLWWVVAWDQHYPYSQLRNVKGTYETEEQAAVSADALKDSWDFVEVVNVKDMIL